VDRDAPVSRAMRISDRVGTALCDACEQRLGRQRPFDGAGRAQTVSGNSAHISENPLNESGDQSGRH
jgi:hypothetical protein